MARDIRQLNGVRYTIASVGDDEQRTPYKGIDLRPPGEGLRTQLTARWRR